MYISAYLPPSNHTTANLNRVRSRYANVLTLFVEITVWYYKAWSRRSIRLLLLWDARVFLPYSVKAPSVLDEIRFWTVVESDLITAPSSKQVSNTGTGRASFVPATDSPLAPALIAARAAASVRASASVPPLPPRLPPSPPPLLPAPELLRPPLASRRTRARMLVPCRG